MRVLSLTILALTLSLPLPPTLPPSFAFASGQATTASRPPAAPPRRRTVSATPAVPAAPAASASSADSVATADAIRALIAQADLVYAAPVPRSEEGMPIGNGRMGSLVWTTPSMLKLQINRVDIQPINRDTNSFFERNTDYMGGAGFVDLELSRAGDAAFPADGTTQRLSVYDGLMTVRGRGLQARLLAWHARDLIAIALEDRREAPEPIQVNLRMLRYAAQYAGGELEQLLAERAVVVRTRNHTATSRLLAQGDRILLTQEFREGAHVAKSAVAIAIAGRDARPRFASETEVQLVAPAARGGALVLIASAATLDAAEDVSAAALRHLDRALTAAPDSPAQPQSHGPSPSQSPPSSPSQPHLHSQAGAASQASPPMASSQEGRGDGESRHEQTVSPTAPHDAARVFDRLAADNAAWWRAFWARGALALHSADGLADEVARNYHYYLYLMAATSRGAFPPKFNGMLWNTAGDLRTWGAQHWFANLSCYYEALFAANRLDLLDPMFEMYSGMIGSARIAARQQWGSEGLFIPETVWFDGLATLPDDIAAEMRDLYLLRKPWAQRSERFLAFSRTKLPHSSRWNWYGGGAWHDGVWTPTERGFGPFGPVTHILGTTAKVAYLYWRRYEFTGDEVWLRDRAWPMLEGAAEFYRTFPNLRRDADGLYHIHHVNSNESVMGARDTDEDLSALRGILAVAIRASERLHADAAQRARWKELLDHLAPLPTSESPDALRPADYAGPPVFVRGRTPAANGRGFTPDGNSLPMWFFDLVNLESPDAARLAIANATFDRAFPNGIGPETPVGVLSKLAIAGTTLGRVEATRFLVPNQIRALIAERATAYRGGQVLANRMTLREGPHALDAQRLGRAAEALQLALLQNAPGTPGGDPVLRLFPAWPPDWDARFTLRARGAFVVSAARAGGRTAWIELTSEAGAVCRLRNPWGAAAVALTRNGRRWRTLKGTLLSFETVAGDVIRIVPALAASAASARSMVGGGVDGSADGKR